MNENRITSSISAFFTIYLINERGLSINTIKSYRDTFILFFRFLENEKIIKFNKIALRKYQFYTNKKQPHGQARERPAVRLTVMKRISRLRRPQGEAVRR